MDFIGRMWLSECNITENMFKNKIEVPALFVTKSIGSIAQHNLKVRKATFWEIRFFNEQCI